LNPDDNIFPNSRTGSLRRLLRFTLAYPKLLWQAAGLLLIATLGQVLSPIVIKVFIDNHVVPGYYPANTLMLLGAVFVLLYLSSAWAGYLQAMRLNRVAFSVVRTIRAQVFASVIRKPLAWFDHRPTGKLVSGITNDTEAIKDLYVQVLSAFVQNITLIIAIFIAMAILDIRLMLVCSFILPTVIIVMIIYQRLSSPRYHRARSILSQINASLSEAVSGMRVIQIMNQQRRFANRFTETSQSYFRARMSNLKLDAMLLRPMPDLLRMLTLAGLLLYFGVLSMDSPLEVGVMYAFINYLSRITQPITEMTQRLSMLQQALVAGERVFTLIDADEEPQQQSDQLITSGKVKFDRINFSYDQRTPVLRDISFNIEAGQFFAVVGHTGSGKSTLMSLLLRFYTAQQGRILLDDKPLENIDQENLRNRVGVVLQDAFITVGSVRDNITLGREMAEETLLAAAKQAQLHDFVMSLPQGYDTQLGERGGNFSTGQRQLLSLARTLAHEPAILILDEATASVDSHTEAIIQQALIALHGRTTIIAIAHRLSTITRADQIIVLHQGEMMQQGSHQQLMQKEGLYRHMYELQQKKQAIPELAEFSPAGETQG